MITGAAAFVSAIVGLRNSGRIKGVKQEVQEVHSTVEEVHKAVNGTTEEEGQ